MVHVFGIGRLQFRVWQRLIAWIGVLASCIVQPKEHGHMRHGHGRGWMCDINAAKRFDSGGPNSSLCNLRGQTILPQHLGVSSCVKGLRACPPVRRTTIELHRAGWRWGRAWDNRDHLTTRCVHPPKN